MERCPYKRNPYAEKRIRKKAAAYQQLQAENGDYLLQLPTHFVEQASLNERANDVSTVLQIQLAAVGVKGWLLGRASIYHNAFETLTDFILNTPMASYIREEAILDLEVPILTLKKLFQGDITLKTHSHEELCVSDYEGYSEIQGIPTYRLKARHRLADSFSSATGLPSRSAFQVIINKIGELTVTGRVVADSYDRWRCGLRLSRINDDSYQWCVSIDAGQRNRKNDRWYQLGPLSQAIGIINTEYGLPEANHPLHGFTFHYKDPQSEVCGLEHATNIFEYFNLHLYRVLQGLSRTESDNLV